jgi:hypothetical protein
MGSAAEHRDQLGLEIDGVRRQRNLRVRPGHRGRELGEHERLLGQLETGVLGVRPVVQPDREHLRRQPHWRPEGRLVKRLEPRCVQIKTTPPPSEVVTRREHCLRIVADNPPLTRSTSSAPPSNANASRPSSLISAPLAGGQAAMAR